jgi:formylglycine-generating enzyme required for sulfatase activity
VSLAVGWVDIPAGDLVRGTPAGEVDAVAVEHGLPRSYFAKEAPRSVVPVARFAIARVPVTVDQWRSYTRAARITFETDEPGSHPIDDVSWLAATGFCRWAADELRLPVRLPAEVEWERAARGDDARAYPWGDDFDPALANLAEHGAGHALPVGSLPAGASPFGVLDMAGNVDEWTSTVYGPYPGAPDDVPAVEEWAADPHVTRGGDYRHHRDLARCARRHAVYAPRVGAGLRLAYAR